MKTAVQNEIENRRGAERYSIQRDVRWRLKADRTRDTAAGRTLNISSSGVLFASDISVPVGKLVEVAISWPVSPDGEGELQLIASGRVVRCAAGQVAVHFDHREFRPGRLSA